MRIGPLVFFLLSVSQAPAQQTPNFIQADAFHIDNCVSPCVAQLALTQAPASPVTISLNGVQLTPDLYQITASNSPQQIVVSFSGSAATIQNTDVIVATYAATAANPTE